MTKNTEYLRKSDYIKNKRKLLGMTLVQFAEMLNLQNNGERTVGGWERGEHEPSDSKWEQIVQLTTHVPFSQSLQKKFKYKFIDLFAGIGGIRLPFQELGGLCVFTSEWDKFSQKVYATNFGHLPSGDITQIKTSDIPDHDILLGGFPCQAFSQAGLKKGFNDSRGTMFFEIQRILAAKRPKAFLLENVKQLKGHDKGRTLKHILETLEGINEQVVPEEIPMSEEARKALSAKLRYQVFYKVLKAKDFGAPQNRERIFIIGFDKDYFGDDIDFEDIFEFPIPPSPETRLGDILEESINIDSKYTLSDKLWQGHLRRKEEHKEKGNGFGYSLFTEDSPYANTLSARYYKDGSEILIDQSHLMKNPRKLTPRECARLQGFPENFIIDAVSDVQAYKQFGNSVCIYVVRAVANQIIVAIDLAEKLKNSKGTFVKKSKKLKKQIELFS
jgi:DNA (cytosine-5)-methyltransferase 1